MCCREANIQQCHRNLLAHKDCAYSNQGPKYNPERIRLRRFALGLPVSQPHLWWFAPHVLGQFSSSPLLVRQTIGWPVGDLLVQLAGQHAGQGRKALWRNLCLPHSIFQYISCLSLGQWKKKLLTLLADKKKTSHRSPFHRLRFTGTRFCGLEGLSGYPKKGWTFEQHQQKLVGGLFQREGSHTHYYCWKKSGTTWDYWKQNHWKHLIFQVV